MDDQTTMEETHCGKVDIESKTRNSHGRKNSKLTTLFLTLLSSTQALAGSHERRLLNDLMNTYNKLERPVPNETQAIVLKFGLTLQQIMDVDEKNQLLTTNVWLNLEWEDANMRWNESEYGNVKDIRVPPGQLWKPDILMYNSASEAFDGTYPTNVVVTSHGLCTYIPPGIFLSSCPIDITWFPFDDQDCEMKFGSWTYNGFKVDFQLQSEEGDISSYVSNGEWALLGVPATRNEVIYDCCPEPYLDITFVVRIRRRTLYYFFNLIVPCLLIASMAVLGFTLPPDSGEKLSLGVNLLLAIVLFGTIVGDMLPVTNTTPLIGTYFNCIMFMVASSVITTILVLNYHHRQQDTHEMPEWVSTLFLQWLPWALRMTRPGVKITKKSIMMGKKMRELEAKEIGSKSVLSGALDMEDDFRGSVSAGHFGAPPSKTGYVNLVAKVARVTIKPPPPPSLPSYEDAQGTIYPTAVHRELGLILKEIKVVTDKMRDEDESSAVEGDWKFAAMVLDRLCLVLFTIFTALATIIVLMAAPHVIVK